MEKQQRCHICKIVFERTAIYFYRNRARSSGFVSMCKKCSEKRKREKKPWDSLRGRYNRIKSGAKIRGIPFSLSIEDIESFWQAECYYCGKKIETLGVDRIDFRKGYSKENIISCCKSCNSIKGYIEHNLEKAPEKMISFFVGKRKSI